LALVGSYIVQLMGECVRVAQSLEIDVFNVVLESYEHLFWKNNPAPFQNKLS